MKLSSRSVYGLKAVLNLAMHYGEGSLPASQIARDEKIPLPYLEQIFYRLKAKHWIRSTRGPSGGYRLCKPPAEIKVGSILRVLEDKDLRFRPSPQPRGFGSPAEGAAGIFWAKLSQLISEQLDTTSLKSLIDQAAKLHKARSGPKGVNFNI